MTTNISVNNLLQVVSAGTLPELFLTSPLTAGANASISAAELAAGYPQATVDRARIEGQRPAAAIALGGSFYVTKGPLAPQSLTSAPLDRSRRRFRDAVMHAQGKVGATQNYTGPYWNNKPAKFLNLVASFGEVLPGILPGPARFYGESHPSLAAITVASLPMEDSAGTAELPSMRQFVQAAVEDAPVGYVPLVYHQMNFGSGGQVPPSIYTPANNPGYMSIYQAVLYVPSEYLPLVQVAYVLASNDVNDNNYAVAMQVHPDMRDFVRRGFLAEDYRGTWVHPAGQVFYVPDIYVYSDVTEHGVAFPPATKEGYGGAGGSTNYFYGTTGLYPANTESVQRARTNPLFAGQIVEDVALSMLPLTDVIYKEDFMGVPGALACVGSQMGGVVFTDGCEVFYENASAFPTVTLNGAGTHATWTLPIHRAVVLSYSPSTLAVMAPSSSESPGLTPEQRAAVNAQSLQVVKYRTAKTSPLNLGTKTAAYAATRGKAQAISELMAAVVLSEKDLDANGQPVVPEHETPVTYSELATRASGRKYYSLYLTGVVPASRSTETVTVAADGTATLTGGDLPDGTTLTAADIIASRMDGATFDLTARVAAQPSTTLASWFLDVTGEPLSAYDPDLTPGGGEFSMNPWLLTGTWDIASVDTNAPGQAGAMMMAVGAPIEGFSGIVRAGYLYGVAAMQKYRFITP